MSEVFVVSVTIPNVLGALTIEAESTFSIHPLDEVTSLPLDSLVFEDSDAGAPGTFCRVVASADLFEFTIDSSLSGSFDGREPIDTGKFYTQSNQIYEMTGGACPVACPVNGDSCTGSCGTFDTSRVSLFAAVMACDIVQQVLRSIEFIPSEISTSSLYDNLTVSVNKFSASDVTGVETSHRTELYIDTTLQPASHASNGVCFVYEAELSTSFLVALLCSAFWWEGPTQWALRGGTVEFTILGRVGQVIFFVVLVAVLGIGCVCASGVWAARFAKRTNTTLNSLAAFLKRDEEARLGDQTERSFPLWMCYVASCCGCCGLSGLCTPRREGEQSSRGKINAVMRVLTCWLVPVFYDDGNPPTTWGWWLRDQVSWIACRGCGVVPELARQPKQYEPTASERAAEEEKEMLKGEWKGQTTEQIQAVFNQHAAAEVARGRARMWRVRR